MYRARIGLLFSLLLLLTVGARSADAQVVYNVVVNTSAIAGQSGYVDLQFNPGGVDALDTTAIVNNVTTDGAFTAVATDTGAASGSLPSPPIVTLANTTAFNDLFQAFTFGNSLTFAITFSGMALVPSLPFPVSGSTFALSLYASDQTTPLLTTDIGGSILLLDINPDGSTSVTNFSADLNGSSPVATATLSTE